MNVTNNSSQSFGSIQVGISNMNGAQKRISDRLFDVLKYTTKYAELDKGELDVYMLSGKGNRVRVKFLDPYSGNFVKTENNKPLVVDLGTTAMEKVEEVADKVIDIYEKIVKGIIKRPEENVENFMREKTDFHRVNPDKAREATDDLPDFIEDMMKSCGYSQKGAEDMAFDHYKRTYAITNKDADF